MLFAAALTAAAASASEEARPTLRLALDPILDGLSTGPKARFPDEGPPIGPQRRANYQSLGARNNVGLQRVLGMGRRR